MLPNEQDSPVSELLEGLGIENASTNDEAEQEDLNLNDSSTDESTDTEVDEPEVEQEETDKTSEILARLESLEKEKEIADKRLADKDKYINELKQQIDNKGAEKEESTEVVEEEDFWDNPEGLFKAMKEELLQAKEAARVANLRVDESYFAQGKPDYLELVNKDNLTKAFQEDSKFAEEFQQSAKPYEVAYNYLKSKQEATNKETSDYRAKIEQEILAKYGLDKKNKEKIPSVNKIGSSTTTRAKESPEDGFASVFGRN